MKTSAALIGAAVSLALAACVSPPGGDPSQVARINRIMQAPARVEDETPAQRDLRQARERAFGQPIGLLSANDRYDPPRLIRMVAPVYPGSAAGKGKSAEVGVGVIIDTTGRVQAAKVIASTDPAFNEAALAAVTQWRFSPGRKDGQLISMSFVFPVEFSPP